VNPKPPSSKRKTFLLGLLAGAALGIAGTWGWGLFSTHYHPIEESKLCYLALTQHRERLHPQTREYLKGRYYSNAAIWISPDWMSGWMEDFGPVDDAALGGLDPIKDVSSTEEVRQAALQKHGVKAGSPQAAPQPQ
jgi:hypothetical protein